KKRRHGISGVEVLELLDAQRDPLSVLQCHGELLPLDLFDGRELTIDRLALERPTKLNPVAHGKSRSCRSPKVRHDVALLANDSLSCWAINCRARVTSNALVSSCGSDGSRAVNYACAGLGTVIGRRSSAAFFAFLPSRSKMLVLSVIQHCSVFYQFDHNQLAVL